MQILAAAVPFLLIDTLAERLYTPSLKYNVSPAVVNLLNPLEKLQGEANVPVPVPVGEA